MQSLQNLRELGIVDREMIEHRVREFLDAREAGDITAMVAHLAPDVVIQSLGDWRPTMLRRSLVGKAEASEAFRMLNIKYENLGSTIHELMIDGDRLCLHRTTTIRERGASQSFTFDVIDFVRFRDGLIVEIAEYPDAGATEPTRDPRGRS